MSHIQIYQVYPTLPEPLAFLEDLARNLWWSWDKDAKELFRRIDLKRWTGRQRQSDYLFEPASPSTA